jgi:hypothetical protein
VNNATGPLRVNGSFAAGDHKHQPASVSSVWRHCYHRRGHFGDVGATAGARCLRVHGWIVKRREHCQKLAISRPVLNQRNRDFSSSLAWCNAARVPGTLLSTLSSPKSWIMPL